jgi:FtsH-binding integral membrane protein
MTYLSNVARPMLRISATIILAFSCAFVLLFSGVVGYGVRSLIH